MKRFNPENNPLPTTKINPAVQKEIEAYLASFREITAITTEQAATPPAATMQNLILQLQPLHNKDYLAAALQTQQEEHKAILKAHINSLEQANPLLNYAPSLFAPSSQPQRDAGPVQQNPFNADTKFYKK